MSLTREQKQAVVAEVADVAASALSVVAAEYRGIGVSELTDLRAKARQQGVYLRVVKNTLARRALEGTEFECIRDQLTGPLMLAFSQEDPGAAARLVDEFIKGNDVLKPKIIAIGGKVLDISELKRLASLPNREQALAMLLAVLRAPLDKLARTLNEVPGKLVRTVAAVKEQKG